MFETKKKNTNTSVPNYPNLTEEQREKNFEKDYKMLQYFQDEFKFRHRHYWSLYIRFFILTVIVAIFPVATEVLGIKLVEMPPDIRYFFPAISLLIALFGYYIMLCEADRMVFANKSKYRIINVLMESKYQYTLFEQQNKSHKWMASILPHIALVVEIIIVLFSYIMIRI